MISKNRLLLSAPGSGKTTFIVNEILQGGGDQTLITTYTDSNAEEIRQMFIRKVGSVPKSVTILPWFSFLLQHGVRPYQGAMDSSLVGVKVGFCLQQGRSGQKYINTSGQPVYWGEDNFKNFYFTHDYKIYSDKISKFIHACNKKKAAGEIIGRMTRIFKNVYVDEVQDLAGWDLELVLLLFKSGSNITLVGDPRQTIYSTNDGGKHKAYRGGKISEFLRIKGGKRLKYDEDTITLKRSHRNNQIICDFSSLLYPSFPKTEECECNGCNHQDAHMGLYLINEGALNNYKAQLKNHMVLKWSGSERDEMNFGVSKGKTFDHVIIWPTDKMCEFLKTGDLNVLDSDEALAKLYVAITRARHSVAFVYDYEKNRHHSFDNMKIWNS